MPQPEPVSIAAVTRYCGTLMKACVGIPWEAKVDVPYWLNELEKLKVSGMGDGVSGGGSVKLCRGTVIFSSRLPPRERYHRFISYGMSAEAHARLVCGGRTMRVWFVFCVWCLGTIGSMLLAIAWKVGDTSLVSLDNSSG